MTTLISEINWLAILLATIIHYFFGAFWYSPLAFEKKWAEALGFQTPKEVKYTPIYFWGPLVTSIAAVITMAILMQMLTLNSPMSVVFLASIIGLGFMASVSFVNAITPAIKKPILYGLVTGSYHTIGLIIVSIIIFMF